MGNDNSLLIVVLAVVAYFILTAKEAGKGLFGSSLFGATAETPAGTITSTGAVGAATEISKGSCLGYIFNPVLFAACIAGKTTTITQSPQTPAPTQTKCPYDPNLLYGDSRCTALYPQYPTSEGSISSSELCDPSSPYYVGDAVANAPGGCIDEHEG